MRPYNWSMRRSQMLKKVGSGLPAKIWRLVVCTEMVSWELKLMLMHAMAESRPFDRENLFSQKKLKTAFFCKKIDITFLWEDLEAKLLTPGQFLGFLWKLWGITVQTSHWEGRWHQNWVRSRPSTIRNFLEHLQLSHIWLDFLELGMQSIIGQES